MLYREFRNSDPPVLADIWRSAAPRRGWVQPMSVELFEQHILAKPYFDRRGLIVAEAANGPVGFVHACFGPNAERTWISHETGVVAMLIVRPEARRTSVASELLTRAEDYLRSRGTKEFYGGGTPESSAFYLGLYGGVNLPGVLDSDPEVQAFFHARGFETVRQRIVLERELAGFRAPVDRVQLQHRRKFSFDFLRSCQLRNWWEAMTDGQYEIDEARLRLANTETVIATARVRHVLPLSVTRGARIAGLYDLQVDAAHQRQGVGTFLIGELLRRLGQEEGIGLVEVQCESTDEGVLRLCRRLGFVEVDRGQIMRLKA